MEPPHERGPRLGQCPGCGSGLVQPRAWRERPDGRMTLELLCPECLLSTVGDFEHSEVAEYDEALVRGRLAIETCYEAVCMANMRDELGRLRRALELDLIGADDFSPARAAR